MKKCICREGNREFLATFHQWWNCKAVESLPYSNELSTSTASIRGWCFRLAVWIHSLKKNSLMVFTSIGFHYICLCTFIYVIYRYSSSFFLSFVYIYFYIFFLFFILILKRFKFHNHSILSQYLIIHSICLYITSILFF